MGGAVTKNWELEVSGKVVTVQLRHNTITGSRAVELNGTEVYSGRKLLDDGDRILIDIDGKSAIVLITAEKTSFQYSLEFEGQTHHDLLLKPQDFKEWDCSVRIPTYRVDTFEGKLVAFYDMEITYEGRVFVQTKRFKDFAVLDDKIHSAFKDSHLYENLPQLPEKKSKLLTNHLDHHFLEQRRSGLESYINGLLHTPKACTDPDFLIFLKKNATLKPSSEQEEPHIPLPSPQNAPNLDHSSDSRVIRTHQ